MRSPKSGSAKTGGAHAGDRKAKAARPGDGKPAADGNAAASNVKNISIPAGTLAHLDDTNRKIVAALQHDGRRSFSSLARELGLSEGAVRQRVNHMQEHEHLRFLAIIDPVDIGYMSWAVLGIKVRPGVVPNDLAMYFKDLEETIWVASVAGRFDLVVEVWVETPVKLNRFLEEHCFLPGLIANVETMVGMRLYKWG